MVLYFDGSDHWLADGFHRYHAELKIGAKDIESEVRVGTQRDAVLFSVGANKGHGLRASNADKHKAVETLLNDNEWSLWSDRAIARECGASYTLVSKIRRGLTDNIDSETPAERTFTTKHGTQAVMRTANIGKMPKVDVDEAPEVPPTVARPIPVETSGPVSYDADKAHDLCRTNEDKREAVVGVLTELGG